MVVRVQASRSDTLITISDDAVSPMNSAIPSDIVLPTHTHTPPDSRPCYLTDKARRTFVAQFERRMQTVVVHPRAGIRTTWRGCIDLQIAHLIQVLRGEAEKYLSLEIR
jgi:CRISPR/Cas system-associated endonuclease Cas1